jgi:LPXTG-site transpeptidase (sortase) family protein
VSAAWPWIEGQQWQSSPEAARAARNAAAPPPIWVTPGPTSLAAPTAVPGSGLPEAVRNVVVPSRPTPLAGPISGAPQPASTSVPTPADAVAPDAAPVPPTAVVPVATPTPDIPSNLQLASTNFEFLDAPEPGANARLTLSVHNPTADATGPVRLDLPLDWLTGYQLRAAAPAVIDGRQAGKTLELDFEGPPAGDSVDLQLEFVTTDEVIDAPALSVFDADGRLVGRAQPRTEAPPAQPGPIYSVDIPSLKLHSGVVPVDWEPPLFVVGQVKGTAFVTQGNSVLVGHVRGASGYNVFDHLDKLSVGDDIIASSRGEDYRFVVTQTQVLPEDDTSPTQPTDTPRLTLMTCAGTWNPLTQDYSDRLWVVAEPVDRADATASAKPTPSAEMQVSPRGGIGNTDADVASAFGSPSGESAGHLAVYRYLGGERRAQFADLPDGKSRRAALIAAVPPRATPLTFDAAVSLSRGLLPKDAQPVSKGPEGNDRFVVERFSSASAAQQLPAAWFTDRKGQPGDLLVVYKRRPDGRIAAVAVTLGDDPTAALDRLSDVPLF